MRAAASAEPRAWVIVAPQLRNIAFEIGCTRSLLREYASGQAPPAARLRYRLQQRLVMLRGLRMVVKRKLGLLAPSAARPYQCRFIRTVNTIVDVALGE
ncbi:hypothetical protein HC891_02790 [Candidatus Gracilibacteria bacterium]|nr:hypothetical protein [Candidatus Gracilibacteria bacterium]